MYVLGSLNDSTQNLRTSKIRTNRMKVSAKIPKEDELNAIKIKKKVLYLNVVQWVCNSAISIFLFFGNKGPSIWYVCT